MADKFKHIIFNPRVRLCLGVVIFLTAVGWIYSGRWQIWQNPDIPPRVEQAQAASWYSASWGYRKTLTIDYTKVSTTLSNFPVMVSTTDSDLTSYASSTGADILFTSSDGATKLSHEIESYTSSTGKLIAWVNVTSLSDSADTVLYMYYGNSGAADQQATTSVWDSNFKGVWHLKEDPSGSAPQMKDSSSNVAHGTAVTMASTTQVQSKINGSLDFNGVDDYVGVTSSYVAITGAITVSLWVNADVLGGGFSPRFASKNTAVSPNRGWEITSESGSGNLVGFRIFDATGSSTRFLINEASALTTGNWVQYVGVYNPSTALMIYKNGVQSGILTTSIPATQKDNTSASVYFANRPGANCSTCYLNGKLDEIRISNSVRTSGWILTDYNNQSSPSTFYSWGSAETPPTYEQSGYRFFGNIDSTVVGSAPVAENTTSSLPSTGAEVRLRLLLHVAGSQIDASGQSFKLQFVGKGGGSCASPSGGTPSTYTDVTGATAISFKDNTTPADGDNLTASSTADPTHSGHTVVAQDYEEANNFTNSVAAIPAGQDGLWDFSLYDNGAPSSTTYCFRVVKSDDALIDTYTFYPEITTAAESTISVVIDDSSVAYGLMTAGSSTTTIALGETQTVYNNGSVVENFNIKGQDTACPWTLASSVGADQYVHEFSTSSGSSWTPLTTSSYQSLASGYSPGGNFPLDLRITVPSSDSCADTQFANVIVQAVQQ